MMAVLTISYYAVMTYLIGLFNVYLGAAYLVHVIFSLIQKAEQLRKHQETIEQWMKDNKRE